MSEEKQVRFSQHALEKFETLAAHGFLTTPDKVEVDRYPPIAQRRVGGNTVLRVVYTEDDEGYLVITFYPGERKRYED